MTPDLALFPDDYAAARTQFRGLATAADWVQQAYPLFVRGPDDLPLTIDSATWDPPNARGTVIVTSGLHGAEGALGSALQAAYLSHWASLAPTDRPAVRLVFVHALNPYGYAWRRRVNEDNVDLNRNFLAPGQSYSGAPDGYAQLNPMLNPGTPPVRWEPFRIRALWAIARLGLATLKQAIATGQYEYPRGLFFGGHGTCVTTRYVRQVFPLWLGEQGPVIHLDVHSGLGESGQLMLLAEQSFDAAQLDRITEKLGHRPHAPDAATGIHYRSRGSLGMEGARLSAGRDYQYFCAEFGTFDPVTMLTALRAENRAHHSIPDPARAEHWAKDRLEAAFCPIASKWRRQVLTTGFELIQRAVASLS